MRRTGPVLLLALLAACRGEPQDRVKIALAVPLTGDLAADGRGLERAARLAFEEDPQTAELVVFDDRGDPLQAVSVARQIAEDPAVLAVVGHLTSGCSVDAARVYAAAGIPMITPSATAPVLTLQQESGGWPGERVVFRLPPSDAVQGDALAEHAVKRLGARVFAVLHDRTAYGLGIAEAFTAGVEKRGGKVAVFEPVERGARDFSPALDALDAGRVGALFYGGVYPEAGPLLRRARARGFSGHFLAGDGVKSGDFVASAGPAAEGALLSVAGVPLEDLPSAADFAARYQARHGEPPRTFDHYGYEAARIALAAARKAGRDRRRALDWIRAARHESMVGPFIFDSKGDSLKSLVTVLRVERGRFVRAY
ncbi:MAG: branched-chain amino acid ABC transporter substrate-binding protein [Elusimicrobiota bacterium]|nr:branched-chain amino acid ABC transporter substrate-binding protein [Elusimicrobiota bacterium]